MQIKRENSKRITPKLKNTESCRSINVDGFDEGKGQSLAEIMIVKNLLHLHWSHILSFQN